MRAATRSVPRHRCSRPSCQRTTVEACGCAQECAEPRCCRHGVADDRGAVFVAVNSRVAITVITKPAAPAIRKTGRLRASAEQAAEQEPEQHAQVWSDGEDRHRGAASFQRIQVRDDGVRWRVRAGLADADTNPQQQQLPISRRQGANGGHCAEQRATRQRYARGWSGPRSARPESQPLRKTRQR